MMRLMVAGGLVGLAALLFPAPASAQVNPPPGWVADLLVGRLDDSTPRLTAITNAAFGTGVMAATVSNGILTVRRIGVDGSLSVLAVIPGLPGAAGVTSLTIDDQAQIGGALFVGIAVPHMGFDGARTLVYRIRTDGTWSLFADSAQAGARCYFLRLDLAPAGSAYGPFFYCYDGLFCRAGDGTELLKLSLTGSWTTISNNTVPPGRVDLDTVQVIFDRGGEFGGELIVADSDSNNDHLSAIYALRPNYSWRTIAAAPFASRRYLDMTIGRGGPLGTSAFLSEVLTDTVQSVAGDGAHTVWASGFVEVFSVAAAPDGEALYVSDRNGVYRIRLTGDIPGPTLVCRDPVLPNTEPFRTAEGVAFTRLVWSMPVTFSGADISVINEAAQSVPASVSGSGSPFMLISFGTPLFADAYTIVVRDTVRSVSGAVQIDGDGNGVAGGDATIHMRHVCPADHNGDGTLNSQDFFDFLTAFFAGCP